MTTSAGTKSPVTASETSWRCRLRRTEHGAVLVMAVPGLVLAAAALALSVDIGRQVLEKRSNQSVADMASLDAARDLANAQAVTEAAAARNGFDTSEAGSSVVTEMGSLDSQNRFTPGGAGSAVRVTVSSVVDYIFAPGSRTVTSKAVAAPRTDKYAGFSLGSSLASLDTTKAPLLNRVLGKMMKGAEPTGGNADVVGWKGLVDSEVTLGALRQELVDAGVQAGTLDELLAADLTIAQVAQATAAALTDKGDLAGAAVYSGGNGIVAQATNTATFRLGQLITVEQGAGDAASAAEINAFQLLTATAMAANGTNFVTVDSGLVVPNVSSTEVKLKVIEAPRWVFGPEGATGTTSQVELTATPSLDLPITVAGLTGARATGALPLAVAGGQATGTMEAITCADPGRGITVGVASDAYSGASTSRLRVSDTLGPLVDVFATGAFSQPARAHPDLGFSFPGDFTPEANGKRAGSTPFSVAARTTFSQTAGSPPVLVGVLPLGVTVSSVANAVLAALPGVAANLDSHIVAPLASLGVTVGVADVTADKKSYDDGCSIPPRPVLLG